MEKIGVRALVTFVLRSGSIDTRRNSSNHSALEGTRIHAWLQKKGGESYSSEVFLKTIVPMGKSEIQIEGRADGIIRDDTGITIDEIKTSETPFEELAPGTVDLFWAQAMCYGHIVCQDESLDSITLQLSYYQTNTKKLTVTTKEMTAEALAKFFEEVTTSFEAWVIFKADWRAKRDTSLQDLKFPYGHYRKGQRELAVAVYKTIATKQILYAEAPTGTGKTISTLFPALKGMGEGLFQRLFYLTAKTSTRQVAEAALKDLGQAGAELKSVTLTARAKVCFMDEVICTPEYCPYANGYYDRVQDGLRDILEHENELTRPVVETYAKKHTLCPFEFALDASTFCDTIIGDYNYLFDPRVYLQRFFTDIDLDNFFLVDEAHNLVSRGRQMYSASLSSDLISQQMKVWPKEAVKTPVGKATLSLKRAFARLAKQLTEVVADPPVDVPTQVRYEADQDLFLSKIPFERFNNACQKYATLVHEWLPQQGNTLLADSILVIYLEVLNFLKISDFFDDGYVALLQNLGVKKGYQVRLVCLDPGHYLQDSLQKGLGAILFSATLSPLRYYQDVLGATDASLAYQLPSPFQPEKQGIFVSRYVDTTYQNRDASLNAIVESLHLMVASKTGNYLCFFPSYTYLDQVLTAYQVAYPTETCLRQNQTMDDHQRQEFLAQFTTHPTQSQLGFCVLGGAFSEGVDLQGDRLIGVAIVSVGLPGISLETNLLKDYYQHKNQQGFDYAYQLPGMNNVMQAAGRLIRGLNDTGVILLLDRRFSQPRYTQLMPPHWAHYQVVNSTTALATQLNNFWKGIDHENATHA